MEEQAQKLDPKTLTKNLLIMYFPAIKKTLATGRIEEAFDAFIALTEGLGKILVGQAINISELGRQLKEDANSKNDQDFLALFDHVNWQLISNLNGAVIEYSREFNIENPTEDFLYRRVMFQWLGSTISLILNLHKEEVAQLEDPVGLASLEIPQPQDDIVVPFLEELKQVYPLNDLRLNKDIKKDSYTPLRRPSPPPHNESKGLLETLSNLPKYILSLVFMPGQLVKEFPESEWIIRAGNIIFWVTVTMLIPSLITLLGGSIDDTFLPSKFPALEGENISISAIELFSGLCALTVVGLSNIYYSIKNHCFSTHQDDQTPKPSTGEQSPPSTPKKEEKKKRSCSKAEESFSLPPTLRPEQLLVFIKQQEPLSRRNSLVLAPASPKSQSPAQGSPKSQTLFFSSDPDSISIPSEPVVSQKESDPAPQSSIISDGAKVI